MVKDHSDSEKGNPLPPHRLLLSINSKGSFICTSPGALAGTRNNSMGPPHEGGTCDVNIVCDGHECNILFITVELLN